MVGTQRQSLLGRRALVAMALIAAALAALAALHTGAPPNESTAVAQTRNLPRPNIVVIQTDDQTAQMLNPELMPRTWSRMVEDGIELDDYVTTTPICCPSRSSLLTGQYAHNHHVLDNTFGYEALRNSRSILPRWLQRVGYRTAHLGKYMNGFSRAVKDASRPPIGWNFWQTSQGHRYWDYVITNSTRKAGRVTRRSKRRGSKPADHLTDVLNHKTRTVIARLAEGPRPFYLQIDQFAPHGDARKRVGRESFCPPKRAQPAPGDGELTAELELPKTPAYGAFGSGEPAHVASKPALSPEDEATILERYRCAAGSLVGVDRGVRATFNALRRHGELHRTVVVFISDNGLNYGEHRVPFHKATTYEEVITSPAAIRLPPRWQSDAPPRSLTVPAANIDLAPTFLDLARARPCAGPRNRTRCRTLDGRSLWPALQGRPSWGEERAILIEKRTAPGAEGKGSCAYDGIRQGGVVIVHHLEAVVGPVIPGECEPTDDWESYDLASDPYQLDNDFERESRPGLLTRLEALTECAGIAGRDPSSGNRPFCE